MGYRLTPEERRIIERAKREGEEIFARKTPAQNKRQVWKSVWTWVLMMVLFAAFGLLICYVGTLWGKS